MFINKSIKNIKPYKLSSHKAWQYKNDKNILKLDWNESTQPPSPKVIDRLKFVIKNDHLNWYPNTNNIELINKISNYNNLDCKYFQYFASSDALHEYIVRSFIDYNDKITIVGPTYDNFRAVAETNGAIIEYFNLDKTFNLNYKEFSKYIDNNKPKIIYIVNPNNPSGTSHPKEELRTIIEQHQNVLFIIDEAYYEFSNKTVSSLVKNNKNLIISRTFSKAFALASFRIGYVITHESNIKILNSIRNPKNVSLFAQEAAIAALDDVDYTFKYVNDVLEAKSFFENELNAFKWLKYINGHGNFTFLNINDNKLRKYFLDYFLKNRIFIRDYSHVKGAKNYIRITIGTKEEMISVLEIIKEINNFLSN